MLSDRRARSKLREFFHRFLELDRTYNVAKDPRAFPNFDDRVLADLRVSLDMFVDDIVWSEASDYRKLLSDSEIYLNGRLANFYGAKLEREADFQRVEVDNQIRAGVLSHPLLMTGFAYESTSSPIHRGVFIARHLLGRKMRPPPVAVVPQDPKLHPKLTTRERIEIQTQAKACQSCHSTINPLGFSLEHYDAVGRYRTAERDKPINASSEVETLSGDVAKIRGAKELATFLVDSPEAHTAFVDQLFHYAIKQPIRAYGANTRSALRDSFVKNDYNIRKLFAEMAIVAALYSPNKN